MDTQQIVLIILSAIIVIIAIALGVAMANRQEQATIDSAVKKMRADAVQNECIVDTAVVKNPKDPNKENWDKLLKELDTSVK